MGQYFTPIFVNSGGAIIAALHPADYGSGLKLAGHTRADTRLMYAVHTVLSRDGGARLVWAGDYADDEPGHQANLYGLVQPRHFLRFDALICADVTPNAHLPQGQRPSVFGYVCNCDKGEYIDNLTLPIDEDGWRRTPLPRLTAEAGEHLPDYGRWARDRLYYSDRHPGGDWTRVS